MATRDLDRLARHVKAHRLEQYSSRDAAAAAAGVTRNTWKRVEEGLDVRESTYARIEKALGWSTGSCLLIAEGGEPAFFAADATMSSAGGASRMLTSEQARQMAWDTARATLPTAPIGELDTFVNELVENLRRAGIVTDTA
jgi:DNA-binding XRE family transcriptional regulator